MTLSLVYTKRDGILDVYSQTLHQLCTNMMGLVGYKVTHTTLFAYSQSASNDKQAILHVSEK